MKQSILSMFALLGMAAACGPSSTNEAERANENQTIQIMENGEDEWISLFDGENLNAWTGYGQQSVGEAWKVEDGVIHFDAKSKKEEGLSGGDIVTKESFGDFHLKLEWKISKNGNSGIMFYVIDNGEYDRPYHTGPEYQLLDNDGHPDGKIPSHRAGDLYDLIESSSEPVRPVGEWNQTEIISKDGKLEFYLNNEKIVSTTLWDEEWDKMVAGSKFKDMPGFGKYREGKIALQDHGDDIWFRNIEIKRL
ncbi:MAG TPA: DUF1080 domain-containing protein [Cyclobacteriaceae bacterium]|nr:DUF1080 domain-containing protein [Cyclobacteriaceae bacterium]